MDQPRAQHHEPQRRNRDADGSTCATGMREPGDPLKSRDQTARRHEPGHRREYAVLLGLLATLAVAGGWAGLAHAADASTGPTTGLTLSMAVLLGIVQGITEFLPISSDGHLALGQAILGLQGGAGGHRFTIVVHAGTLLAVVWTYRDDLLALARTVLHPAQDSSDRRLLLAMLVASLPLGLAVLPGVETAIVAMESEVRWVGVWLWVSGLALWIGFRHERLHAPQHPGTIPTLRQAIIIGLAQVTAILPGLSRSGMTISSALVVGLDRAMAARFSFLISVIAVSGAVAKEVLGVALGHGDEATIDAAPLLAGFITSLVVGLFALRGLLLLVGRGRVLGFVVYLAIVGAVAIAVG